MKPTIQHILVPTDFSDASSHAVSYAAALASSLHARVHLVHVLEEPLLTPGPYEYPLPDMPARRERLYQQALSDLSEVAATFGDDVVVTSEVRGGAATDAILQAAIDYGADLIVMGTHGRTGLLHLLAGSVAERVTRLARCPVLAVRPQPDAVHAAA